MNEPVKAQERFKSLQIFGLCGWRHICLRRGGSCICPDSDAHERLSKGAI